MSSDRHVVDQPRPAQPGRGRDAGVGRDPRERLQALGIDDIEIVDRPEAGLPQQVLAAVGHRRRPGAAAQRAGGFRERSVQRRRARARPG